MDITEGYVAGGEASAPASGQPDGTGTDPNNANAAGQQNVPFHQHPRWIERENQWNGRMAQAQQREQQLAGHVQQLTTRLQALERAGERQGDLTPEQELEYKQAETALERLFKYSPKFSKILKLLENADNIEQSMGQVREVSVEAAQQKVASAKQSILGMAKEAGLNIDPKHNQRVIDMVVTAALQIPNGNARYKRGDTSVLTEAFAQVKDFLSTMARPGQAKTAATKNQLRNMPPPARGGSSAGAPAPKPIDPKNPRASLRDLHSRAAAILKGGNEE